MLVKKRMNTDVITVGEKTSLARASQIMKEEKIRSLPVLDKKKRLVGIVTDRDLREASPSMATSLNVHELNYLISKVQIRDIMTPQPVFVKPEETIEFAAILMLDNKISSLPVVNDTGDLVGIITQTNIFKALVNITGVYSGGTQFAFDLEDRPGSIKKIADEIRSFGARLASILSTHEGAEKGHHHVYIRIQPLTDEAMTALVSALNEKFTILYFVHDALGLVEKRRSGMSHLRMPDPIYRETIPSHACW